MFKQPRVPEVRGNVMEYLRNLALFLKDFCADAYSESRKHSQEIESIKKRLEAIEKAGD